MFDLIHFILYLLVFKFKIVKLTFKQHLVIKDYKDK